MIDDEAAVRLLTEAARDQIGHRVHMSEGGAGLEFLRTCKGVERPDTVLLDMTMPGMSGRDTMLAIRKLYPAMPSVLSSGYSQHEVLDQFSAIERQNVLFLPKPYTVADLTDTIAISLFSAK